MSSLSPEKRKKLRTLAARRKSMSFVKQFGSVVDRLAAPPMPSAEAIIKQQRKSSYANQPSALAIPQEKF